MNPVIEYDSIHMVVIMDFEILLQPSGDQYLVNVVKGNIFTKMHLAVAPRQLGQRGDNTFRPVASDGGASEGVVAGFI